MTNALPTSSIIGVIGAGTMGAGIAQVAAQAGHPVLLFDAWDGAAQKGKDGVAKALSRLVEKGKMAQADRDALLNRITVIATLADLAPAKLVVEAIVERLDVKQTVFGEVEAAVADDAILASNTSSLSLTAIGATLKRPQNLVGMHFFNPAPLMALVEVISGVATAPTVAETVYATAKAWGKVPVHAASTPGFIVNRVARPYYAEALRVTQEGAADPATIDAVLTECGGFRMGPFDLMDLIGHDVNYAVTNSVFDAYYKDKRFLPSLVQKDLVDAGWLGRKSGRGFYDYAEGAAKPAPATAVPAFAPASVEVHGETPLDGRITTSGMTVSRADEGEYEDGVIVVDGVVLVPSDGRMATEIAAEEMLTDVVVYDLALDYGTAKRIAIAAADQASPNAVQAATGFFQALGFAVSVIDDVPGLIVTRTVAMLANEAADAVYQRVATAGDVDLAMTKGVNYPRGPLAWAEDVGLDRVLDILENLFDTIKEDRFRPSVLLRRKVLGGGSFHA
ncbi:MAG: 3-hydroxyacyl-CoA dehydrogenase PaaH [Rhodospirillaceae bacterium]